MATGTEAVAVVELVSAIIALVESTKKVYDAAHNAAGLPHAFREVRADLPIVEQTLEQIKEHYHDNEEKDKIKANLEKCKHDAEDLEKIFQKVCPGDHAGWFERYRAAARTVKPGRNSKVEGLMSDIMKQLQLLQGYHVFTKLTTSDQLKSALDKLAQVEPSLPDEGAQTINSSGPGANFNTSSGTQQNYAHFGTGEMWNVQNMQYTKESGPVRNPMYTDQCIVVPDGTVNSYTQRPDLMQQLEQGLKNSQQRKLAHAAAVTGLGGTGKSQLVLGYVETYSKEYDTILWIDGGTEASLRSSFESCCEELNLPFGSQTIKRRSRYYEGRLRYETSVQKLLTWLSKRHADQRWLVVLDDAQDSVRDLFEVLPKGPGGSVIVISQDHQAVELLDDGAVHVKVDRMEQAEAVNLLLRSANCTGLGLDDESRSIANGILDKLDNLAIAISLAGSTIRQMLSGSKGSQALKDALTSYCQQLSHHHDEMLWKRASRGFSPYQKTIHTVWDTALTAIHSYSPDLPAAQMLKLMTFLDRRCIQKDLFRLAALGLHDDDLCCPSGHSISPHLPPWLRSILTVRNGQWDEYHYHQIVQILLRFGLVRETEAEAESRGLTMHGLVSWRARRHRGPLSSQWSILLLFAVCRRMESSHPKHQRFARHLLLHLPETTSLLMSAVTSCSLGTGKILRTIGWVWLNAGRYEDAEKLYHKAFKITFSQRGWQSAESHSLLYRLAWILLKRGEAVRAARRLRRILAARLILRLHDDPEMLAVKSLLASTYRSQGQETQAAILFRDVADQQIRTHGIDDPRTLTALGHCAMSLLKRERSETAALLLVTILERQTTSIQLGDWHPDTTDTKRRLAMVFYKLGDLETARDFLVQVMDWSTAERGTTHPHTLWAIQMLAKVQTKLLNFEDAEKLLLKVIEGWRKLGGDTNAQVRKSLVRLLTVYRSQKREKEAMRVKSDILKVDFAISSDNKEECIMQQSNDDEHIVDDEMSDDGMPADWNTTKKSHGLVGLAARTTPVLDQALKEFGVYWEDVDDDLHSDISHVKRYVQRPRHDLRLSYGSTASSKYEFMPHVSPKSIQFRRDSFGHRVSETEHETIFGKAWLSLSSNIDGTLAQYTEPAGLSKLTAAYVRSRVTEVEAGSVLSRRSVGRESTVVPTQPLSGEEWRSEGWPVLMPMKGRPAPPVLCAVEVSSYDPPLQQFHYSTAQEDDVILRTAGFDPAQLIQDLSGGTAAEQSNGQQQSRSKGRTMNQMVDEPRRVTQHAETATRVPKMTELEEHFRRKAADLAFDRVLADMSAGAAARRSAEDQIASEGVSPAPPLQGKAKTLGIAGNTCGENQNHVVELYQKERLKALRKRQFRSMKRPTRPVLSRPTSFYNALGERVQLPSSDRDIYSARSDGAMTSALRWDPPDQKDSTEEDVNSSDEDSEPDGLVVVHRKWRGSDSDSDTWMSVGEGSDGGEESQRLNGVVGKQRLSSSRAYLAAHRRRK